jgi:hypothetical protein
MRAITDSPTFFPAAAWRTNWPPPRGIDFAPGHIAISIMRSKHMDLTDRELVNRMRWKVTDCRRRMAARGV